MFQILKAHVVSHVHLFFTIAAHGFGWLSVFISYLLTEAQLHCYD